MSGVEDGSKIGVSKEVILGKGLITDSEGPAIIAKILENQFPNKIGFWLETEYPNGPVNRGSKPDFSGTIILRYRDNNVCSLCFSPDSSDYGVAEKFLITRDGIVSQLGVDKPRIDMYDVVARRLKRVLYGGTRMDIEGHLGPDAEAWRDTMLFAVLAGGILKEMDADKKK